MAGLCYHNISRTLKNLSRARRPLVEDRHKATPPYEARCRCFQHILAMPPNNSMTILQATSQLPAVLYIHRSTHFGIDSSLSPNIPQVVHLRSYYSLSTRPETRHCAYQSEGRLIGPHPKRRNDPCRTLKRSATGLVNPAGASAPTMDRSLHLCHLERL